MGPARDGETMHPKDDPRSVEDLVSAILTGDIDEDLVWDAMAALHWRGTREVLDRALELCRSRCPAERRTGAYILGQLGVPDPTFPEECLEVLLTMLGEEREPDVLNAVLTALGHLHRPEALAPGSRFRDHPDPWVRHAVALLMGGSQDPLALGVLMGLMEDPEPHVRDWATFGLGSLNELDTPEIRDALAGRLGDDDLVTRCEAIVGLARRQDRRMLGPLLAELASEEVDTLAVEAAALIGDPTLHPALLALQGRWGGSEQDLAEALEACSPRAGARNGSGPDGGPSGT